MAVFEDRDVWLARLEGLVDQHTERLKNIENWLRVIVVLHITSLAGIVVLLIRLAF